MWKYNKYALGDIVTHSDSPDLDFQIFYVLKVQPEIKGEYIYYCKLIDGYP
ncbi:MULTISPECIES: hypothetical protein [unclassified Tenacibaculum]|uniref:hypothetical protein n=1 Tax=unclassified Tenacibaculum TaxID=2635139 RepID=UPI00089D5BB6|nr:MULTISPECIES: hypothetical protein [unclassified Tenacibaculum]SEE60322.1 hypothetical protein SAMN04487765_3343 [Tenacibaculum sp. MAR_2010_89]